uniref:Uncharacterized protein n=1 Tax=Arundo donax TaxID=35708 RepID=A0A0A9H592_ARUDO
MHSSLLHLGLRSDVSGERRLLLTHMESKQHRTQHAAVHFIAKLQPPLLLLYDQICTAI